MARRIWLTCLLLPVMLTFAPSAAADRDLRLQVDPARQLPVGERSCVGVATTGRRGAPRRARVTLNGRSARTGPDGRARICTILRWGGTFAVHAYRRRAHAFKLIRTTSGGLARGRWVPMTFGILATPSSSRCHLRGEGAQYPIWGEDLGFCATGGGGHIAGREAVEGAGVLRFEGSWPVAFVWSVHPSFDAGHSQYLTGESPSPTSDQLQINWVETFRGQCEFEGGSDPDRIGRPGGPARLTIEREWSGGRVIGFRLAFEGWVFERGDCPPLD